MSDPLGTTLSRFILMREREHPGARGEFSALLEAIGLAGRLVARATSRAGLADVLGVTGGVNVQGERVKKLDVLAHDALVACLDHVGHCCVLASEEVEDVIQLPDDVPQGDYAVAFDPLDGSSNTDNSMPMGTIFSIYRRVTPAGAKGDARDFLRVGSEQVAAGYVVYGSSTMLVYTCGSGAHGFTLDPSLGVWLLSHPTMRIPERGRTYSCNTGNRAWWTAPVRAHVEALESRDPDRKRPYGHRYVGALVADFHRTLLEGGIFLYPADTKDPRKASGKLRLLYEGAPLAFVAEQAGGAATDGARRILDIRIETLHQRVPLFLGSRLDVEDATAAISGAA